MNQLIKRLRLSPHRHPPKYFMRASKSTILTWNADIKNALKHTLEHNKQKQFLITRFAVTPDGAPGRPYRHGSFTFYNSLMNLFLLLHWIIQFQEL